MSSKHILIYVEDPGAANYVIGLPVILKDMGYECTLLAEGAAVKYIEKYGEETENHINGESAKLVFARINPCIFVMGTSENRASFAFELLEVAKECGVYSLGIVDAFVSAEQRFCGYTNEPLKYITDALLVPDVKTKKRFVELGVNDENIFNVGNPRLDAARDKALVLSQLDFKEKRKELFGDLPDNSPVVVFMSELSTGLVDSEFLRSNGYTLNGWGDSDARTDIVLQELIDSLVYMKPSPSLVVHLHPKENIDDYKSYSKHIVSLSLDGDPLQLAYFADVVVGLSTTLLLEVSAMGVPVISIVPREVEREWVPQTDTMSIVTITQKNDIDSSLKLAMSKPRGFLNKKSTSILKNIAGFLKKNIEEDLSI